MATIEEVEGTLRADGTLVLDRKLDLPPGRVLVTVQPAPDYSRTEIGQFFQRLWSEQEASGQRLRTPEEIDADLAATDRDDEEYRRSLDRIRKECGQHGQGSPAPGDE